MSWKALVGALLLCMLQGIASAELDPTFGAGGVVTTPMGGYAYGGVWAEGGAVAVQPDGKLVVAGESRTLTESGTPTFLPSLALARYNTDGSLDATFGAAGVVTEDPHGEHMSVTDVAVQSTGKVVVSGWLTEGTPTRPFNVPFLVRYNSDGTLDETFGGGSGVVTIFLGTNKSAIAEAVSVLSNDKLIVVGGVTDGSSWKALVARFNADGVLDTGFGISGLAQFFISGSTDGALCSGHAAGRAVAIQDDGKIVIVGAVDCSVPLYETTESGVALARLHTNGSLDSTFGYNGAVVALPSPLTTPWGGAAGRALAIQPDGKIVVAAGPGFVLERFTQSGAKDTGFGTGGTSAVWFGGPEYQNNYLGGALSIVVQPDGTLVAAGRANLSGFGPVFALVSYSASGTPSVPLVTKAVRGGNEFVGDMARQPDGKLVVVGNASLDDPSAPDITWDTGFAVARYEDTTGAPTAASCPPTPLAGCLTPPYGYPFDKPGKGNLTLKLDSSDSSHNKLKWGFQYAGFGMHWGVFGDPRIWDSYALCVYDDGELKVSTQIPRDELLWQREISFFEKYNYKDKTGYNNGITKVKLYAGPSEKAKIQVSAVGITLPAPVSSTRFFNDSSSVVVQFSDTLGTCFETTFDSGKKHKNTAKGFNAKL